LCCLIGTAASAYKTESPILWAITAGFVLVAIYRYIDMTRFAQENIGPTDVEAAAKWEVRATYGAMMFAGLCSLWCFASFAIVKDPAAESLSMVITVGCMVGVVARNFGLDRLLTMQVVVAVAGISAGIVLDGDIYNLILGAVMLPMLISFRFLAADIRQVLLNAVHGRVDSTRLALELDTALDTMQHGLCMLDEEGRISVVNNRAEQVFTHFAPGSWTGRAFAALIAGAASRGAIPQRAADRLLEIVALHGAGKVVLRLADDEYCEVTVSSMQGRTVALFEDITARVKAEERINYMAHYDALTGLPNRAYFSEQVGLDLERRDAGSGNNSVMLTIVDIDDFKHVNDTMGHLIGDKLLVQASQRLNRVVGPRGVLARYGGDEFMIYRGLNVGPEDVHDDPAEIIEAFKTPFDLDGEIVPVNVSIGVVLSSQQEDSLDALMTKADLALYKAKANGKAQAQAFHNEMDTQYRYRQKLKAELKIAVQDGHLTLAFQPLIDLKTRRVVACEALARWHHPQLGSIPPSLFIPIAEETGLISDISRWVLREASLECRSWPSEVSVSVNISARDFRNADVAGMVGDALRMSGLEPHRLELEVTETALIEERGAATTILSALAKQGIGIALDDFGTGYSSLSYLQALPFTKLKVDRSFVRDITTNPRSLTLLANVASLGKDINLTVTAEGVETEEQLALIQQHTKVDQIQGFLFGVPLPRREVAELIARMAAVAPRPAAIRKQG
jgi:diguanylate cyclase (GGDEF)-like protein